LALAVYIQFILSSLTFDICQEFEQPVLYCSHPDLEEVPACQDMTSSSSCFVVDISKPEAIQLPWNVDMNTSSTGPVPLETTVPMETEPPLPAPVAAGIGPPMVLQQKGAPSHV
jgi:hypothetical protein